MFLQDLLGPPPISMAPPPPQLPTDLEQFLMNRVPTGPQVAPEPVSQDIEGGEAISSYGRPKIERKGMFGVKGTLRDILGTVGDTYLMTNGRKPIYGPTRLRERKADALQGFIDDPLGSIQQMYEAGFPDEARDLYNDYVKKQQVEATQALARQKHDQDILTDQALIDSRKVQMQDRAVNVASRMLSGIQSQEELNAALPALRKYLDAADLTDFKLPSQYGEQSKNWGLQQYQSNRLEDYDLDRDQRGSIASQRIGATIRGQDIRSADTQRGQDIRSADTRRGQDLRGKKKPKQGSESPVTSGLGAALQAATSLPPKAPRKKGDIIAGPNGSTFVSPDGKTWVPRN